MRRLGLPRSGHHEGEEERVVLGYFGIYRERAYQKVWAGGDQEDKGEKTKIHEFKLGSRIKKKLELETHFPGGE